MAAISTQHDATMHQQTADWFMQQPHPPPFLRYAQSQGMFTPNVTQGFWQSPELLAQWQNMALQYQQSNNPYLQQPNFLPPQMMMMQYNQMMFPFATPYMQISMDPAGQYYPMYSTNAQPWFPHDTYQAHFGDDDFTLFDEDQLSKNNSAANIKTKLNYCPTCNTNFDPKHDHLESPEHHNNVKYHDTLTKCEAIVQKAKMIVQSPKSLLRLQISNITDCIKKYNIEKCAIEGEETVSLNRVQTLDSIGSEMDTLIKAYHEL